MTTKRPEDGADELVAIHGSGGVAPTRDQWLTFLTEDDDRPILVVYQVRFHDRARYPEGSGEPERTGAEAFFHAGTLTLPAISDQGGVPVMGGFVRDVLAAPADDDWDYIGAARYPSRSAFVALWLDDRFIAAQPHRVAGTRRHRLTITRPLDLPG